MPINPKKQYRAIYFIFLLKTPASERGKTTKKGIKIKKHEIPSRKVN